MINLEAGVPFFSMRWDLNMAVTGPGAVVPLSQSKEVFTGQGKNGRNKENEFPHKAIQLNKYFIYS